MNVLDEPVRRDDPDTIELHELLIQAYDDEVEALALAGQVGLLKADIERFPKLRFTWWSILEEAAREGQLRRLVETALRDPTVAAWHPRIRTVVDAQRGGTAAARPAPRSETERRDAQFHPEVGATARLWEPGRTLRARFLDGPASVRAAVDSSAQRWFEYTNLKLEFGDDPDAEIRVSFDRPGSWSYLGIECLRVPRDEPTANFGWLDANTPEQEVDRVVLHEFGHVIGLQHETGNPASTIHWNREAVYSFYQGPPHHWTREVIDNVFFAIWPPGYFPVHKVFDQDSIMMVPGEERFVLSGKPPGWNLRLSPLDKQFAAALYPQQRSFGG